MRECLGTSGGALTSKAEQRGRHLSGLSPDREFSARGVAPLERRRGLNGVPLGRPYLLEEGQKI